MSFSFSSTYNKKKLFNIDTTDFEYKNLEELWKENAVFVPETGEEICSKVFPVCGVYLNNKTLYEPHPIIATDEFYVNLPANMFDSAFEILSDPRAVRAINDGKVGFQIEMYYQKRYDKVCYTAVWVDM